MAIVKSNQITPRRIALLAAAVAASILTTGPAAEAGKKDDTLVWATDRDNPIADPFYLNTRELVVVGHHVWDTLVIIDPKSGEIKPLLATKWAWIDPTTLEMELRTGVKFHSGKEMDADDVVYTLNHVSNKDNAIANFALLSWIKNAEKISANKVQDQPTPSVSTGARLPRRCRLHHAARALRQGPRQTRRQKGLRRRAAQRHRPLPDRRGQAWRAYPDGKECRLLQGRLQGQSGHLQNPLSHHQGCQHPRRRADDGCHRLDLGRPQGSGRAHQGQSRRRG